MQCDYCVGDLTKITSELVYGAVVLLAENGIVWHSLSYIQTKWTWGREA